MTSRVSELVIDETTLYLKEEYDLVMQYNTDHTIKKKTQSVYQGTVASLGAPYEDQAPVYKNSYILDYSDYKKGAFVAGVNSYGYLQPHAPRTIVESPSWAGSVSSDDPRVRHKLISYDANGNQTEIKEQVGGVKTSLRKNLWDEENRLTAVNLKPDEPTDHPIAIYTYDAGGERIVRYNMDRMDVSSNAEEVAQNTKENVMLYPSGLLMGKVMHKIEKGKRFDRMTYTKHYYIGSERISAKTGTVRDMGFYPANLMASSAYFPQLNPTAIRTASNATVTDAGAVVTTIYNKFALTPPPLQPIIEENLVRYDHDPTKLDFYYFHPDHLGSASYITNKAGTVSQHMEYLPFGETLVDEHTNSFNSPFKYNGKEYDEETGNYYYGARYYDPKWSIFISVDPLAEMYPNVSPYTYCLNNPIKFTDPTGMSVEEGDDWVYNKDTKEYQWDSTVNKPSDIKDDKYEYVGSSVDNVVEHHRKENPISSIIKDPIIGNDLHDRWPGEIQTEKVTFYDKWAKSNNVLYQAGYDTVNGAYVTLQALNPFDENVTSLNGHGLNNVEITDIGAETIGSQAALPFAKGTNSFLKVLNAAQFSKMFKGTFLTRTSHALRGTYNRIYNRVMRRINERELYKSTVDNSTSIITNDKK